MKKSEKIGKYIFHKRVELGLSIEKFAELINRKKSFISRVERGEVGISRNTAANIIAVFGNEFLPYCEDYFNLPKDYFMKA